MRHFCVILQTVNLYLFVSLSINFSVCTYGCLSDSTYGSLSDSTFCLSVSFFVNDFVPIDNLSFFFLKGLAANPKYADNTVFTHF